MAAVQETIDQVKSIDVTEYKYGFVTELEVEKPAKGLTEDTVRYISARKNEPEWMLEWRLDAFRRWKTMTEPTCIALRGSSRSRKDASRGLRRSGTAH